MRAKRIPTLNLLHALRKTTQSSAESVHRAILRFCGPRLTVVFRVLVQHVYVYICKKFVYVLLRNADDYHVHKNLAVDFGPQNHIKTS